MEQLKQQLMEAQVSYEAMRTGHAGLGGFNVAMGLRMVRMLAALDVQEAEAATVGLRITEAPDEVSA